MPIPLRSAGRVIPGPSIAAGRLVLAAAALCWAVVTGAVAAPAGEPPDNLFTGVTAEIATPHFARAKPYVLGTTRVLVLAPAWGQRETVELMQRYDFDCRAVMTDTKGSLAQESGFLAPDKVARRLDEGLAWKPEVIVIGGLNWDMLLLEHRAEILRQVAAGAGLVYVDPPASEELAQLWAQGGVDRGPELVWSLPWQALNAFSKRLDHDIALTGDFGAGRWCALRYATNSTNQSLTPALVPCLRPWEYEYYLSLVARAVLVTAGREPQGLGVTPVVQYPRGKTPAPVPGEVNPAVRQPTVGGVGVPPMPAPPVPATGNFSLRIYSTDMVRDLHRRHPPVPVQRGQVSIPTPMLPASDYLMDFILTDEAGRTWDWETSRVQVSSRQTVTALTVPAGVAAGEAIRAQVALAQPLAAGQSLVVSLLDNHDRLLAAQEQTGGAGGDFTFKGFQPLGTAIHRVTAAVYDELGEVHTAEQEFAVRGRARPAFHLACWEESETDHLSALWYRRLRDLGMDAIFYRCDRGDREAAARLIAEADLFGASSYPGYHPKVEQGELGPVHVPCLHDPRYQAEAREATHRSEPFALYDNLFYPSGSDAGMRGNCFAPPTLAAFRTWLQQRYPSLQALNSTWGTSFASWDTVVPATLQQVKAAGAAGGGAQAGGAQVPALQKSEAEKAGTVGLPAVSGGPATSWIEHTRFMEQSYRDHLCDLATQIRRFDAGALVGEDGYGWLNSEDGADWAKLLPTWGFYNLYTYQDPPQMEITRSLCRDLPNVKLRSLYWGSYDGQFGNYAFLRRLPWYALLHDYNGLFWWIANGKTTYPCAPGAFAGPDLRATRSALTSLREIGEIRTGVAELIQPARRQHNGLALYYDQTAVHAGTAFAHPSALVTAYETLQAELEDLGLQYEYVSGERVAAGALTKPAAGSQPYRVLILARALALSAAVAAQIRAFVEGGGTVLADVLPGQYDEYLRPAPNGSLLAEFFGKPGEERRTGRGRAILLGDFPADYPYRRYEAQGKAAREKLQALLQDAALPRTVTLTDEAGAPLPGVELVTYARGEALFIACLSAAPKPVTGMLSLPQPRPVYDLRGRKHLGGVKQWPVTLQPGETSLFAALPYEVAGVTATPLETTLGQGESWQARVAVKPTAGAPCAAHSFTTVVLRPDGGRALIYEQSLPANEKGAAVATIPFALSDPPGDWRVRVTETVSGIRTDLTVRLTAR